ncbi:MAG: hypothetical protein AAB263_04775, partial [Planctomycetota bacterium]
MQVVLPLANTAPFPLLKQAYYTYALSAWTHSVGLIIGLLTRGGIAKLDQAHAASLKELAFVPSSAHNLATIYECGFTPVRSLAAQRLCNVRERLLRVRDAANEASQPLSLIDRALAAVNHSASTLNLPAPPTCTRAPVVWDAPLIDPLLFHLAEKIEFFLEHTFDATELEALKTVPDSPSSTLARAAANNRRRSTIATAHPTRVCLYSDGSVLPLAGAAGGTAALLFLNPDDVDPCATATAPTGTCSFWAEAVAFNLGLDLAQQHTSHFQRGCTLVAWSDSLSWLQQLAKGPAKATTAESARSWQSMLSLLNQGRVSRILLAHHFSHVDNESRSDMVDEMAKGAAATFADTTAATNAPHWWQDDARQAVNSY